MSILEVTGLCQSFGDKTIYKNAAFSLYPGEHMGVCGANGAGKSTLIDLLAGRILPDAGEILWQPGVRVGYLDQHAKVDASLSVEAYLHLAFARLYELEQKMNGAYGAYAESGEERWLLEAGAAQAALEAGDFYTVDTRVQKVARGLGLYALGLERPLGELSGGQRAKVILAKLLLEEPEVLLLDEPTNFLDAEHVAWLAEMLRGFSGAAIVVSHDSAFLAQSSTCILDVENGSVKKYYAVYDEYLRQKALHREEHLRQYTAQQKMIERTEAYIRKNIAGVNSKNAKGRRKQLGHLERIAPPTMAGKPYFRFLCPPCDAQEALRVEGLSVGYETPLLPPMRFTLAAGETLAVTGFNGIGKSTLLKTLMGLIPPLAGAYGYAPSVRLGYYEQELHWADSQSTPLQIIHEAYPGMTEREIRSRLAGCGLKNDSVLQPVVTLSGGEQSKVKLCQLLLTPCNFLLLDEPTNHLDAVTKAQLREALLEFEGSVLLVSHEPEFYDSLADRVWQIDSETQGGGA